MTTIETGPAKFEHTERTVHDILFTDEMVRQLIAGTKTETRRLQHKQRPSVCHYGNAGHTLWVKETWKPHFTMQGVETQKTIYRATETDPVKKFDNRPWKSSLLMPKWRSRISLRVLSITLEQLHSITPEGVTREGILRGDDGSWLGPLDGTPNFPYAHAHEAFAALWNSIHGKNAWAKNPWLWVIKFERM